MQLTKKQLTMIREAAADTRDFQMLKVSAEGKLKKMNVTYLLGAFLGGISAHRFYCGQILRPIAQFILNCLIVGWVWTLADVILMKFVVDGINNEMVENDIYAYKVSLAIDTEAKAQGELV